MCGCAALIATGRAGDPGLLAAIGQDLFHRGPDAGAHLTESDWALVFRRLSILDLTSSSDQPMTDASGRYSIVFNGEIYNYQELRSQLEKEGCVFRTRGDTEVFLQGFIQWGEPIFARLEGMFAAVIIDRASGRAYAARDPLGIKPLYRTVTGTGIVLGSETRPLRRLVGTRPDTGALGELLSFRFAGGRRSNFEGVEKVPGGTLLEIDLESGRVRERRYLDPLNTIKPERNMTEADALALAEEALLRSLRHHLQSDVGYTLQLSGGVDSSLISALAAHESGRRLASFAVRLSDPEHDEGKWRAAVVQRYDLDHHEVEFSAHEFAEAIPKAIAAMEGPTPHFGCVMLMLLCERIREHGKVVLTGEGADEFFGGYDRYRIWKQLRRAGIIGNLVPTPLWRLLRRYEGYQRYAGRDAAVWSSCYHDFAAMNRLFPELDFSAGARDEAASRFPDFRSRMLAADQTVYLESLLLRQDKMAMASSVEARVPFCHMPLARVLNTIPHHIRIPGGDTKPLLKRIAERYLPAEVIHRRKVGLTLPLNKWLSDPTGLGRYLELLEASDCRLATYGSRGELRRVVEKFRAGHWDGLPSLPVLVNVELWLRSLSEQG